MVKDEVPEPGTTEWASQVVFAPSKDESLHFFVDYRQLNSMNLQDRYAIPNIDDFVDSLGKATIFFTLDARSGYWQNEDGQK